MRQEKFENTLEMEFIWNGQRWENSDFKGPHFHDFFIQNDNDGSLAILNQSELAIYIESSLNSLKTSQRVVVIQPNESSTVFEMKDFKGKDLRKKVSKISN